MIKNKDGSYNIFRLSIIVLISLISIFIIGTVIVSNIEIPKIEIPQPNLFKETPIPTTSVDPNLFSNYTYNNTSENRSWLGETYEIGLTGGSSGGYSYPENVNNITVVAYGGGGGAAASYNGVIYYNTTPYVIVAGGGSAGGGGTAYMISYNDTSSTNATTWNWSYSDNNFSSSQEPIFSINQTSSIPQTETHSQNVTNITMVMLEGINNSNILFPLIFIIPIIILSILLSRDVTSLMIGMTMMAFILSFLNIIPITIASVMAIFSIFMIILRTSHRDEYR